MNKLLKNIAEDQRDKLSSESFPDWKEPMLATLTKDYFDNENWIYERKLDGVRSLIFNSGSSVSLKSRNQNNISETYPELAEAIESKSAKSFIADGEVVAFKGNITSFSRLQNRINISDPEEARSTGIEVYLYLFDILHFDGCDTTKLPLRKRKQLLKEALKFEDPVRITPHRNEEGIAYHKEACDKGWEGIIAKDGEAAYVHSRSKKWLKFKCTHQQEFVIGGYTDPSGGRIGFGALLLGYYEDEDLQYAGQVGTGFKDEQLKDLHKQFENMEQNTNPFAQGEIKSSDVHWIRPELLAEVGFTEWTDDNKLRHPRFLGLRTDKEAEEVHKEQ